MTVRKIAPIVFTFFAAAAQAAPVTIRNDALSVSYDGGRFTLSDARGRAFATDGKVREARGEARAGKVDDRIFGGGQVIEVASADGSVSAMVFPNVPFALFKASLRNGGGEARVENQVALFSAALDLGRPASELKAIGTGGLLDVEKNTGSYAWLAVAEPQSRSGVVAAWLTHDRGSGVVLSPVSNGQVRIEAQVDYGRLRIKPGASAETETLAVGFFDDARIGLEAWADAVAKNYAIKLPPQPSGFCTWYTEKHSGACDETNLAELAAFAAKELKPFGFDFVQIDDHWQAGKSKNGPCREFMNAKTNGPYPSGMKATAENISKLGLTPGIWFMPFAGTSYDTFFLDHQDWFYKDKDGKPFEARWGGTCLDMTVPGARDYLKNLVHRIAHEWGYKVFKMDGLWTGTGTRLMYVNNGYKWDEMGEAAPADPDKTQIEAYRDGLKLVRQTAGPDVFLLGCCVSQNMRSFGGAFGLLDAMRVGPDTGAGHIGAPHASRNYFLQGRVWQNDPDCVSVRTKTPLEQARVNASFTAITGDLFYNSDWMPDLPAERLDILKRTMPAHGLAARPADYFENDPARIWVLTDTRRQPRRDVVALINWEQKKPVDISISTARLGLPAAKEYVAFDFWSDTFLAPFSGELHATLPAASCRVLAIRPASAAPQLLSTSRHVTQGIVDVIEEKWDEAAKTLSGKSRVVANDPYELRVIVPVGDSWTAKEFSVPGSDAKAEIKQDGPRIRAKISSATSREILWQIKFEKSRVEIPAPKPVTGLKAEPTFEFVTLSWQESGADGYRITRDDGATFESVKGTFVDSTIGHGKKYRYTVAALGWGGAVSDPAAVEVATAAEPARLPKPPAPQIQISSLKPETAQSGFGKPQSDKSIEGKPLTVDGVHYEKGIGTHAKSLLVYKIPAGAKRFVAVAGLDDEKRDDERSSVVFEVYGDVKEMGEPPVLLAKTPELKSGKIRSWNIDVELNSRFKELRLVVDDAGDGDKADHADWADAGFIKGAE